MKKRCFGSVVVLTAVWIMLTENISLANVAVGVGIGALATVFLAKFLPARKMGNIDARKLITFPFYLIAQIYIAGFHVIKVVLKGSKVGIIILETQLKDEYLRIILVDSITLTPGSVLIDLNQEKVTLLWIRGKDEPNDIETAERQLKTHLERRLLKAQK